MLKIIKNYFILVIFIIFIINCNNLGDSEVKVDFGGYIKDSSDDTPIENALIQSGEKNFYTNSYGFFKFSLTFAKTSDSMSNSNYGVSINVSKPGYNIKIFVIYGGDLDSIYKLQKE